MDNWKLLDSGPYSRIAIVDERQTELADGPYEQRKALMMMAAAPDLLSACERALIELEAADEDCNYGIDEATISALEDAICKATGYSDKCPPTPRTDRR